MTLIEYRSSLISLLSLDARSAFSIGPFLRLVSAPFIIGARSRLLNTVVVRTRLQTVRLAERVSGEHLRGMFHSWLYTSHKPPMPHTAAPHGRAGTPPMPAVAEQSRRIR